MSKRLILGLTTIVALLAGAGYAYREYYRPHVSLADVTSAFNPEAVSLIREFESNEARANQKYLSKVLTVQGMVKAVDSAGGWVISLGDTASQTSVRCLMDSTYQGSSDVLLDRCVLYHTNRNNHIK